MIYLKCLNTFQPSYTTTTTYNQNVRPSENACGVNAECCVSVAQRVIQLVEKGHTIIVKIIVLIPREHTQAHIHVCICTHVYVCTATSEVCVFELGITGAAEAPAWLPLSCVR